MRLASGAAIIALLAAASLGAQSRTLTMRELVDLSRAERARQATATAPVEGRVYTSDDLRRYVPLRPEDTRGPDGLPLVPEGSDPTIAMLETFEAEGEAELAALRERLADSSLGDDERTALEAEIAENVNTLNDIRSELAAARSSGAVTPPASGVAAGAESTGTAAEDDAAAARAEWEALVAAKQAEIRSLQDREVEQQLRMTEIRGVITGPIGTQLARNQAREQIAEADATLVEIREALARAQAELIQLQAEEPAP